MDIDSTKDVSLVNLKDVCYARLRRVSIQRFWVIVDGRFLWKTHTPGCTEIQHNNTHTPHMNTYTWTYVRVSIINTQYLLSSTNWVYVDLREGEEREGEREKELNTTQDMSSRSIAWLPQVAIGRRAQFINDRCNLRAVGPFGHSIAFLIRLYSIRYLCIWMCVWFDLQSMWNTISRSHRPVINVTHRLCCAYIHIRFDFSTLDTRFFFFCLCLCVCLNVCHTEQLNMFIAFVQWCDANPKYPSHRNADERRSDQRAFKHS